MAGDAKKKEENDLHLPRTNKPQSMDIYFIINYQNFVYFLCFKILIDYRLSFLFIFHE